MKWFKVLIFLFGIVYLNAQVDSSMQTMSCCPSGKYYKNVVSVGGKYLFTSLNNTRAALSENGFLLDENAFEYQLRLFQLPKIFYFQQLGSLQSNNYASVTGFGLKEDFRLPLIKKSHIELTPYIEVGGGYYRMNIIKGVTHNSISTVLDSEIENYFIDNYSLTGDIGLDLGFNFNIGSSKIAIVANGGYILNYPSKWRLAGSLAFADRMDISSPYFGVTLRYENICCK